jgi:putative flippase GtrA
VFLQFFRFATVGLLATFIHVTIVYLLVEGARVDPVLASLPAFFTALTAGFLLNRSWTFPGARPGKWQYLKYLTAALGGLLLNVVIMYLTVHVAQGSYWLGLALVVTIVPLFSFVLQRNWTFWG